MTPHNSAGEDDGDDILWPECEKCKKYPCPCSKNKFGVQVEEQQPAADVINVKTELYELEHIYNITGNIDVLFGQLKDLVYKLAKERDATLKSNETQIEKH